MDDDACNGIEQRLIIQRFAKIGSCVGGQHPLTHFGRIVGGDDDDRQHIAALCKPGLNFKSAHSGHMKIEQHAIRPACPNRFQKFSP